MTRRHRPRRTGTRLRLQARRALRRYRGGQSWPLLCLDCGLALLGAAGISGLIIWLHLLCINR